MGDERKKEQVTPDTKKNEETLPTRSAKDQREASEESGGFTPRSRKTRIAGVISAEWQGFAQCYQYGDWPVSRGDFQKARNGLADGEHQ